MTRCTAVRRRGAGPRRGAAAALRGRDRRRAAGPLRRGRRHEGGLAGRRALRRAGRHGGDDRCAGRTTDACGRDARPRSAAWRPASRCARASRCPTSHARCARRHAAWRADAMYIPILSARLPASISPECSGSSAWRSTLARARAQLSERRDRDACAGGEHRRERRSAARRPARSCAPKGSPWWARCRHPSSSPPSTRRRSRQRHGKANWRSVWGARSGRIRARCVYAPVSLPDLLAGIAPLAAPCGSRDETLLERLKVLGFQLGVRRPA